MYKTLWGSDIEYRYLICRLVCSFSLDLIFSLMDTFHYIRVKKTSLTCKQSVLFCAFLHANENKSKAASFNNLKYTTRMHNKLMVHYLCQLTSLKRYHPICPVLNNFATLQKLENYKKYTLNKDCFVTTNRKFLLPSMEIYQFTLCKNFLLKI